MELGSARARLGSRASPSRAEPEPAREPRAFFPALTMDTVQILADESQNSVGEVARQMSWGREAQAPLTGMEVRRQGLDLPRWKRKNGASEFWRRGQRARTRRESKKLHDWTFRE
jgi:hypothetical protein